jgi:hypothetical protein
MRVKLTGGLAMITGMRGPSPKKDIHLVVDIISPADVGEDGAPGSPAVAALLRSSAAPPAPAAPAQGLGAAPGASPLKPRQRSAGAASDGGVRGAHSTAAWATVLGAAAPAVAADTRSSPRVAPCAVTDMRAEMAHRLALEYASQFR